MHKVQQTFLTNASICSIYNKTPQKSLPKYSKFYNTVNAYIQYSQEIKLTKLLNGSDINKLWVQVFMIISDQRECKLQLSLYSNTPLLVEET